MKQYFEYKDDKSSKFWEIEITGSTVKTRYGKIGAEGQTSEKKFADESAAQKEYDKLVKEKTKKGYCKISNDKEQNNKFYDDTILDGSVIVTIADLKKLDKKASKLIKDWGLKPPFYFFTNDKTINGNFDIEYYDNPDIGGLVFGGNLTVSGSIQGNYGPDLAVVGNLKAANIDKGGSFFYVGGNCTVDGMIYGYYNHGLLKVEGTTNARYIIDNDHCFEFNNIDTENPRHCIKIDMNGLNLSKLFVPDIIKDEYSIDTKGACRLLAKGEDILIENYKFISNDDSDSDDKNSDAVSVNPWLVNNPDLQLKKAYLYNNDSRQYKLLTEEEIAPILEKHSIELGMVYDLFFYYDGDVIIEGNVETYMSAVTGFSVDPNICLVVNGNLTIKGNLIMQDNAALVVLGDINVALFTSDETEVVIKGRLTAVTAIIETNSGGLYKINNVYAETLAINGKHKKNVSENGIELNSGYPDDEDYEDDYDENEEEDYEDDCDENEENSDNDNDDETAELGHDSGLIIEACDIDTESDNHFFGLDVQAGKVLAVGGQGDTLMAVANDGINFTEIEIDSSGLRSVCISKNEWWVVGEYGFIAKSTDNGENWTTVKSNTKGCLFGIVEDSDGVLWTAGDDGYVACSKDHKTFERVKGIPESIGRISNSIFGILVPTDNPGYLYIINKTGINKTSLTSYSDMMASMVTQNGSIISVGLNGGIFRSEDKGLSFKKIPTGVKKYFTCIGQLPGGIIIAFGENGMMFASLDDGKSFTAMKQDVCTETIWCCKNYGSSLLLGAGDARIYRFGPDSTQMNSDNKKDKKEEWAINFSPDSGSLEKMLSLYFKEKELPDDYSYVAKAHESPELKKWCEQIGRYDISKELDGMEYGDYGFDEILSVAIEETDGKYVAGFRSIFCAVQTIAEGEEEAVFASRAAASAGTSLIFTTHQDEFEDFRYGPSANSITSWLYNTIGAKTKIGKKYPAVFNKENSAIANNFNKQKINLPAHLNPAVLSARVDWLVHIFLSISDSDNIMDTFLKAGTIKDYETEKKHIDTWPHLAAYWLLSHMLLENIDALKETMELSKQHNHGSVVELMELANEYLNAGKISKTWWNEGSILGYRETIFNEAPAKFFTKESYTAIKKKLEQLNKVPEDVESILAQLKAKAKTDQNTAKIFEVLDVLHKSADMDLSDFEKEYTVTPYVYAEKLTGLMDSCWETVIQYQVKNALKYKEHHKKSVTGVITVYSLLFKNFKTFKAAMDQFDSKNIGYSRTEELILIANRFGDDQEALAYLYNLAEKWIDSLKEIESYRGKRAFQFILEKNTKETHRLIAKFLESKDGRREIFTNIEVAVKAREFKVMEAIPGLTKAVEEEMGSTQYGDRGRVIYALVELAGNDAYPLVRSLYDKKVKSFERNEKSDYSFYTEITHTLRGLLYLNEKDRTVITTTNKVFDYFLEMKPMQELHAVCGMIWGIRCGKRKEFIPKLRELIEKGNFKNDDKKWMTEFLNESIMEINEEKQN